MNAKETANKHLTDLRTYEAAHIVSQLITKKTKKILIAGCSWGRDYYYLKEKNSTLKITNLDIAPQQFPIIKADVTKPLPFPKNTFDTIIATELLEHLYKDTQTLNEFSRVLKPNGKLIISVPFYDDEEEFHIRIHSPKTIKRLLTNNGYKIKRAIYRGGLLTLTLIGANYILRPLKTIGINLYEYISSIDYKIGKTEASKHLLKYSKYYGIFIEAQKTKKSTNITKLNIKEFKYQNRH